MPGAGVLGPSSCWNSATTRLLRRVTVTSWLWSPGPACTAPPWARIQNSLGLLLSSRDPVTSRYILCAPLPRLNHYYNYFNMNSHVAAGIGAKTVFESRYECFHLLEVTVRPWTDTAPPMLSISRLAVRTVTALLLSLIRSLSHIHWARGVAHSTRCYHLVTPAHG